MKVPALLKNGHDQTQAALESQRIKLMKSTFFLREILFLNANEFKKKR